MDTNKFYFIITFALFILGTGFTGWCQGNDVVLKSPDGALAITFKVTTPASSGRPNAPQPEPKLFYEVSFNDKQVLRPSALGLELQTGRVLGENVGILNTGSKQQIRDQVFERMATFSEGGGFVFNTVHNILPDVSPENIITLFEAVHEFNNRAPKYKHIKDSDR